MQQPLFDLYSWKTPNGQKVVIALEEAQVPYRYIPIDLPNGMQQSEAFKALSPDGKIPVLVERTQDKCVFFESGAILLRLADAYPVLQGDTPHEKAAAMSWVFWQVGQLGPLAGQFGRFSRIEPGNQQALDHFGEAVHRCFSVLEKQLTHKPFVAGNTITVADIAALPWVASPQSYLQRYGFDWHDHYPAIKRWASQLMLRPSVIKAFEL